MDAPSFSIGITQIVTPNTNRIFDSDNPKWTKNRSKKLQDPLTMVNQSSEKAKAKKDVPASSKAKVEKQQKKEVERLSLPYLNLHYPVYVF